MYQPSPIDTSHVVLPSSLEPLVERLAEHNHDVWAKQRINEGWKWGSKRDDQSKHHPDLVPYADLSDGEKQYDRNSVLETLKAIKALGYRIDEEERRRDKP
jgi:ryanodine receptor 2